MGPAAKGNGVARPRTARRSNGKVGQHDSQRRHR
uniref:Uncharacterized protein n=2 Tax=unclassified Caudoviricetes TaxID=2788787 RepID=A0A8S5VC57_9CAUD|nr:MAG TPA: hypothetical protein [Siphoviridae sp. ctHDv29]DAG04308.1 MAG TPA: hypothetical protein [Siphoviridae sp. ctKsH2]